jgi:hypothetical protein
MSNPTQPDLLRMIARLEQANARSYKGPPRSEESSSDSDHADRHRSPGLPPAAKPRSSRAKVWLIAVMALLLATSLYLTTFAWRPAYLETVKSTIGRWANASELRTPSQAPHERASSASLVRAEIAQRIQMMASALEDLEQQIGQLKASQDQAGRSAAEAEVRFKGDRDQLMRDNMNIADQLKITQEQLKATQTQLAEVVSSETANAGRKSFRRKHVSGSFSSLRARARRPVR